MYEMSLPLSELATRNSRSIDPPRQNVSQLIKRAIALRLYASTVTSFDMRRHPLVISSADACDSTHAMASDGHRGQNPRRLACGSRQRWASVPCSPEP